MPSKVNLRPYLSPTLVFLAFDWPDGGKHDDFIGFAIQRKPGHKAGGAADFLFNKLGFTKPKPNSPPLPSDKAPIQKFHWWDAGISDTDRGRKFTYTVIPVLGSGPNDLHPQTALGGSVTVTIPRLGVGPVATYFNRAVVSSQGFRNAFPDPQAELDRAMAWLANGLQEAIPRALNGAERIASAIYHLTDNEFVMPDLESFPGDASIAYFLKGTTDDTNVAAVDILKVRPKFALAAGAFVWVPALSTVRVAVMSVPPAAMLAGAGVYSVSPPKLAFTPVRCVPAGIVPSGALATVATPTLGLVSLVVAGIGVLLSSWKETASLPSPAPSQLRVALSGAVPP